MWTVDRILGAEVFASLKQVLEQRQEELLCELESPKKMTVMEKGEAEAAAAEFRGFCLFAEGLLSQGSPHEIAGSFHETAARKETLAKLRFPFRPSAPASFELTESGLAELRKAISSFGSVRPSSC